MIRKRYTREFKLSIVQELETTSLAAVLRKHGLHHSTVLGWRNTFEANPKGAFRGPGRPAKPEAVIASYQRLLGQLYAEKALLKKAYEGLKEQLAEERHWRGNTR